MDSTTRTDFSWLLSDSAIPLLKQTQAAFLDRINPVRVAKNLRKRTSVTRAAMVMDQAQLRIRAKTKFALADQMFFTRRSLEQSTGEDLARYKSSRFNGISAVVDLCCGIGGDLISLIDRESARKTIGVDSDPLTAFFANHNAGLVKKAPAHCVDVLARDFADFDLSEFDGIHCDPDRRVKERTIVGSRFSPPLEDVFRRVGASGVKKNLAIKIAPATSLPPDVPVDIEREWIGDRRECKQQIVWHGPQFTRPGNRTATCIDGDQVHQISVPAEDTQITISVLNQVSKYLLEPHPCVLAAGLTDVLARQCGAVRMANEVDYLTSSDRIEHPLLSRFEIVEAFSLDLRRTVEYLKKHQVGRVEVKKRGVGKVLFDQFERMNIRGPHRATVILTRIGTKRLVLIARRTPDDFPV